MGSLKIEIRCRSPFDQARPVELCTPSAPGVGVRSNVGFDSLRARSSRPIVSRLITPSAQRPKVVAAVH